MAHLRKICLVIALPLTISQVAAKNNVPLIALDVGHSRLHSGAISARGQSEFKFNVGLARVIDDFLHAQNVHTVQIGNDGNSVSLPERTLAAKKTGATFFLAIHHDSVQPRYLKPWQWQGVVQQYTDSFSGFSLFVSQKNPQRTVSLQCASAIGVALKQHGFHAATHHAEHIEGEGKKWADQNNGVYYYDNLVVLKTAVMPAVLLEAGVIVNRDEEQAIQTQPVRTAIAEAVKQGLQTCGVINLL
jgi:N-acetylmuramoyl-L-alanine amidase